jgi:hypothetical protein
MWDYWHVKALAAIRHLFMVLALAGLLLAPVARAAVTMSADHHATMMDMSSADAMDSMPCCPEDKAPTAPDCAKECVMMCVVNFSQLVPATVGFLSVALSSIRLAPVSDASLAGLVRAPPPRPPKA